ncbi:MAG: VCBS repeat-containing protein, partial [Bacteroidota bacterium]
DGDLDIACGRRPEEEDEPTILVWFENPGSIDQAWKDHPIGRTEHPIDRIEIGDLDADQQVEIIITEERYPGLEADASIYAFSAGANLYQDWQRQRIALQYSTNNLDLGDIDQDGDLDLLTAEHKGQALELQLWRNDGQGNFQKEILDTGKENHLGTQWVDLDADGDLDIIGAAWDNYRWMHLWRNPQYEPSDQQMANIRTERSAKPGTQIRQTNYEGSPHYVIHTESLTYYYDQTGGGFSRIIDRQGNDWISFKREPWGEYPASAAAAFRGLPNLVYQGEDDGAGHPGHQKCKSWLEGDQIVTQSLSGDWKWTWEFGEDYARLRILQTDQDRPYWFLYEGTPGGKFAPAQTYFGHNEGGPYHRQHDYYSGAILAGQFQWMYAGHQSQQRVFYMLQIQSDSKVDMLSMLGNQVEDGLASLDGMSVWGFGRSADTKALLYGPQE